MSDENDEQSVIERRCPFARVEAKILSKYTRPIRLEKTKKERSESLQTFLEKFFDVWNEEKNTIFADNREVQTPCGKRRSLGDIFMICRYYYPTCTLGEVVKLLYAILPKSMSTGFRSSHCYDTKKRMFYFNPNDATGYFNSSEKDEYGHAARYYRQRVKLVDLI